MTLKGDQGQREEITIETPNPQEIAPPPEAIIASQTPVETNEVAIPVTAEQIAADAAAAIESAEHAHSKPKLCTVIAPSTLEEGYSFPAQVDGIDFVVTVPKGGMRQGEAFQVPYPTIQTSTSANETTSNRQIDPLEIEQSRTNSANGMEGDVESMRRWRTPLCECCEVCGNGLCCYGFFCTPVVLGQVMTRLKLNLIGTRASGRSYQQTFWWMLTFWIVFWHFSVPSWSRISCGLRSYAFGEFTLQSSALKPAAWCEESMEYRQNVATVVMESLTTAALRFGAIAARRYNWYGRRTT